MFRAAVLSIVLTLVAGSSAPLFCAAWCHQETVSTGSCEHPDQASTPGAAANDSCPDLNVSSIPFIREQARAAQASSQVPAAVALAPFQIAPPPRITAHQCGTRAAAWFDERPFVFALRI